MMLKKTFFLVGKGNLLIQCAETLLARGQIIIGVVSDDDFVATWCREHGIYYFQSLSAFTLDKTPGVSDSLKYFDCLISIGFFSRLPTQFLSLARVACINYHDALLPAYAGLYATAWSIYNAECRHGITWHLMNEKIDGGDIIAHVPLVIDSDETTLTLNLKCSEAAVSSFNDILSSLVQEDRLLSRRAQNLRNRTYHAAHEKLYGNGWIDWNHSAETIYRTVRALNFGAAVENRLGSPKFMLHERVYIIESILVTETISVNHPGTVVKMGPEGVQIATGSYDVILQEVSQCNGLILSPQLLFGDYDISDKEVSLIGFTRLVSPTRNELKRYQRISEELSKEEAFFVNRLSKIPLTCLFDCDSRDTIPPDYQLVGHCTATAECLAPMMGAQYGDKNGQSVLVALIFIYFNRITQGMNAVAITDETTLKLLASLGNVRRFFCYYQLLVHELDPASTVLSAVQQLVAVYRQCSRYTAYSLDIHRRYPALRRQGGFPAVGIIFGEEVDVDSFSYPITIVVSEKDLCFYADRTRIQSAFFSILEHVEQQWTELYQSVVRAYTTTLESMPLLDFEDALLLAQIRNTVVEPASAPVVSESHDTAEGCLIRAVKKVLSLDVVNEGDDFFGLGGHSLHAMRLVAELQDQGYRLGVKDIFQHPIIKTLSMYIHREAHELDQIDAVPQPEPQKNSVALSPIQEGMLFQSLRYPRSGLYGVQVHAPLFCAVDVPRLRSAWEKIAWHYDLFKIYFELESGQLSPRIATTVIVPWQYYDWSAVSDEDIHGRLQEFLNSDQDAGFSISNPPLIRFTLIRLREDDYYFVLSFHHAVMDGWCIPLLFDEINKAYASADHVLFTGAHSYDDYVRWAQRQSTPETERFWRHYLAGFQNPTTSWAWQKVSVYAHRTITMTLEHALTNQLYRFTQENKLTVNTIFQALWAFLLSHYSETQDVVFGVTMSTRPFEWSDASGMLGVFINTIPLRIRIQETDSVLETLQRVQDNFLTIMEHRHTALTTIKKVSEIRTEDELFQTVLVFENYPNTLSTCGPLDTSDLTIIDPSHYALVFYVIPGEEIILKLNYHASMVSDETVRHMVKQLQVVLCQWLNGEHKKMHDIFLMDAAEHRAVLQCSRNMAHLPEISILPYQQFEQHAQEIPLALALVFNEQTMTYHCLNEKANQLAHYLLSECHIQKNDIVAIFMEGRIETITAMIAVSKAGAAYLPIDIHCPEERLRFILKDSRSQCMISHSTYIAALHPALCQAIRLIVVDVYSESIAQKSVSNPNIPCSIDQLMYVIYTSGSTGRPKGVMIEHRNVTSLFYGANACMVLKPSDIWTLFHSVAFDFSVWEIWGPLLHGACLVIVPYGVARAADEFYALLLHHRVTILSQTPPAFHQLVLADQTMRQRLPSLRYIVFDGAILSPEVVHEWFKLHAENQPKLINMYGITETTVHLTYCEIKREKLVDQIRYPIGKGFPGVDLYILDKRHRLLPPGFPGELYVGGALVGRGYLDPTLSAQRFLELSFGGSEKQRVYRTGDLVRRLPGGDLDYLGRLDNQVKFQGFRIELDEISAWVEKHAAVTQALTIMHTTTQNNTHLVCYYTTRNHVALDSDELKIRLREHLPEYMVPGFFIFLEYFPLNQNGKINRLALPALHEAHTERHIVMPRTSEEQAMVTIWKNVLGINAISVDDNFFAMGGNSLLALHILHQVKEHYAIALPIRTLFDAPTIAEFTRALESARLVAQHEVKGAVCATASCLVPLQPRGRCTPLFLIHPVGGSVFWYMPMVKYLPHEQPLYAIQDLGLEHLDRIPFDSVEAMAEHYVACIRAIQPHGPYRLGGASGGSVISFEIARQFLQESESVEFIALLDGWVPHPERLRHPELFENIMRRQFYALQDKFRAKGIEHAEALFDLQRQRADLLDQYVFQRTRAPLTLFKAEKTIFIYQPYEDPYNHWGPYCTQSVDVHRVPGDHETMFQEPHVRVLMQKLNACLQRINEKEAVCV